MVKEIKIAVQAEENWPPEGRNEINRNQKK